MATMSTRIIDLLDSVAAVAVEEDISLREIVEALRAAYDRRVCRAAIRAAGEDPTGTGPTDLFERVTGGLPSEYPEDAPSEAMGHYAYYRARENCE